MTLQQLRYAIAIADANTMSEAANNLIISQSSLSVGIKSLEKEIGISLFIRSARGITITTEGEEFLAYARQVVDHYNLIEHRYVNGKKVREKFSVSMQHYSFAVAAFVAVVKTVGMDEYEFAVHETKTYEVIENVQNFKSEIGVLYINSFNSASLSKIFLDKSLSYTELFTCGTYVYLHNSHPLANQDIIKRDELSEYPCLAFEQGRKNAFYLAEEMESTHKYKRVIRANDRATMLNLMVGLNGYTLCSGIISSDLNGNDYSAIPLADSESVHIGYITRKQARMSPLGQLYIEELLKYKDQVL